MITLRSTDKRFEFNVNKQYLCETKDGRYYLSFPQYGWGKWFFNHLPVSELENVYDIEVTNSPEAPNGTT